MTTKIYAQRYHDISCGHRVVGHEGKCVHLHGHNYRIHFTCAADALDDVGRVIDFGVMKSVLCMWLEYNWDHKMLLWDEDPMRHAVSSIDPQGVVFVPFNPTAENIAQYIVDVLAPALFDQYFNPPPPAGFDFEKSVVPIRLVSCKVDETRKCSAGAWL